MSVDGAFRKSCAALIRGSRIIPSAVWILMLLMLVLHGVSDFNSNREVLHVINLEACPKPSFNLSRVLHCGVFFSPLSLALSIYRLLVNFFFFFFG